MEMKSRDFPILIPPAVDSLSLEPPTLVHSDDIKACTVFPDGGGKTKYLLTEETAGCKYINLGLFWADPGQGSQWHTHPRETEEEEFLYVLKGKGTLYFKQGGKDHEKQIKEGDAIFTGHLSHFIKNTGNEVLFIYFSIAPLPETTIIYGVKNDKGFEYVDSVDLKPPQVIHPEGIEEKVLFVHGGAKDRHMLYPEIVGSKYGRFGTYLAKPGTGSTWHTHPLEAGEEDLFYIARGRGTMYYLHGGQEHSFEFKEGDAIHSHHLTNYTRNTGNEDLFIPFSGAPNPSRIIRHKW
jgi:mannose-6-phosphate isomerase-like protein (cupin superfamily)